MFKRNLTIFAATLYTAVAAPAFAADPLGSAVDGVLNPNGREVVQTAQGVGTALGYDVWSVPGSSARVITPTVAAERQTPATEQPRQTAGGEYAAPAFGFQVSGA